MPEIKNSQKWQRHITGGHRSFHWLIWGHFKQWNNWVQERLINMEKVGIHESILVISRAKWGRSVVLWFYSTECQELNGAVGRERWRIIFALSATEIEPHKNRQCVLAIRGNSHEGRTFPWP